MAYNESNHNDRSLVVMQLSGGNDYLNTIVPYENGLYYDNRPAISIPFLWVGVNFGSDIGYE